MEIVTVKFAYLISDQKKSHVSGNSLLAIKAKQMLVISDSHFHPHLNNEDMPFRTSLVHLYDDLGNTKTILKSV